jgi:filamentous hemagglutinin family protein
VRPYRHRRTRAVLLVGASLAVLAGPAAAEGPSGGSVTSGKAEIRLGAERSIIRQRSKRAIIDWKSFDVGRGHEVVFDQPGKRAATLNRVARGKPSRIDGAIRADGRFVIQNNAGVVFGKDARIDAAGVLATSQTVDATAFRDRGRLVIGGGELAGARVANEGRITVRSKGLAALVGSEVANHGVIEAELGTVALASGARAAVDFRGDGVLSFAVAGDGAGAAAGVVNTGTIDAAGGRVLLSAGDAARTLDAAINTSGTIRAASARGHGGAIRLEGRGDGAVRIAGALDASGAKRGGAVAATGQTVELAPAARIDARGAGAGGAVELGGGWQGQGPLRRAERLDMAAGARIAADGGGRGGEVVLWSDGATSVDGTITATGRRAGGAVETSGKFALAVSEATRVDAGPGGLWLLDPRNVILGGGPNGVVPGVNNPPATGAGDYTISVGSIISTLNGGSDVTITTVQPAFSQAGNITVNNPVNWNGAGSLALQADGSITVNANMQSNGAGDLRMTAGGNVLIAGGGGNRIVQTNTGALEITAGGNVLLQRLNAQPSNVQVFSVAGAIDVTAGDEIRIQGGTTGGRWVRLGRVGDSADLTLTAPTITVQGGTATNNFAEVVIGVGGSITINADQINVLNGTGDQGRVFAYGQAPLTMLAENQTWTGPVRAGDGNPANLGGDVTISGAVTASFEPIFALAPDRSFTLAPTGPDGTPSSYTSASEPLTITTSGTGAIEIAGPAIATEMLLVSEERVGLGAAASLTATDPGDSLVVAAGRQFRNDGGSDVLAAGGIVPGRWLLYIDTFAGMVGTEPGPREFDLYGRPYATNLPPSLAAFAGNRIVYGEAPTLTVTADDLSKVYGTAITPTFTLTGLRPGDSEATAFDIPPTVTSDGAPADANVGVYAAVVSATVSSQGYLLELVDGEITVTPAALTVTADDAARLYGSPNPAFIASYAGFVNGDDEGDLGGALALATPAVQASPVGTYAITPSGLTSTNYTIAFVDGVLTVDPAPLAVTIADARRAYGAPNPAFGFTASGFVLGQDASVVTGAAATAATPASDVGTYAITGGTLAAPNYVLSFTDGVLTVDPASLTVTADDASRLYGSPNPAFTASYAGFVNGDDEGDLGGALAFATPAVQASPVGIYAITPSGLTSTNYTIAFVDGVLTVDPAPLAVTIADARRAYGAPNPAFGFIASGFVLGQDASVVTGSAATAATPASDVGTYAITGGTLAAPNYVLSFTDGVLTVDPASLTVTIDDARRAYGDPNPAFTFTGSGFVLGQDESVVTGAATTSATPSSDVGPYSITGGTLAAPNYLLTFVDGTLTVDPRAMRVQANDARRPYGDPNPAFGVGYLDAFAPGQSAASLGWDPTVTTPATPASDVGRYALTPGGIASTNYAVSYLDGALTIDPRTMRVQANDARRLYGAPNPAFTVSYLDPFAPGQNAGSLGWDPAVTTPATQASGVGGYALTPDGIASVNYAVDFLPGTLTVDPVRLTLRVLDQERRYGSDAFDGRAFEAAGFVLGEDASVIAGVLATPARPGSDVGGYAISRGTLAAANYLLPDASGRLAIVPAPLRVTANDAARREGQPNPAFTARYRGFVLGQGPGDLDGALRFATDATRTSPPGRYEVLPGGLAGGNYAISFLPGVLTVEAGPTPPQPAPDGQARLPSIDASLEVVGRGVLPFTPGDAAFRTTRAEAPTARDSTFVLTYSLGEIVQLTPPGGAGPQGFAPAAGEARAAVVGGGCAGPLGLGPAGDCQRATVRESFWSTTFPEVAP